MEFRGVFAGKKLEVFAGQITRVLATIEEVLAIFAGEEDPSFSITGFAVEDIEIDITDEVDSMASIDEMMIFVAFTAGVFVTEVVSVTAEVFATAVAFELIAEEDAAANFDIM